MKRKCIALLLVMMTVFAFFCSGALAAERDSISVNGHASAEVAPDMATLYGNLEKRAAVAETARENLAKDMAAFKKIKNLEKLSAVIDKSVGCNFTVDRVEFGLNNRSLFENRLLEEAVANARSKAAVVARAGGRSLGHLIHASFSTTGNATRAVNRNMVMAKAASMDMAESTPTELDPGVITVDANVDLEFALE